MMVRVQWLPLVFIIACSGANATELFAPATAENTSTTLPQTGPTQNVDTTQEAGSPMATGPKDAEAPSPDAGQADASAEAGPTCTNEHEPNDSAATATPFVTRFCGQLTDRDDIDYGSFVVPNGATHMTMSDSASSRVVYRLTHNGATSVLPQPTPMMSVTAGDTYYLQVRDGSGQGTTDTPTYAVTLSFQ